MKKIMEFLDFCWFLLQLPFAVTGFVMYWLLGFIGYFITAFKCGWLIAKDLEDREP